MHSHNFFASGMPRMPGMPGFSSGGGHSHDDGSQVTVSDHSRSLRLNHPTLSLLVSGHNNTIEIKAPVSNLIVSGHNNKIFVPSSLKDSSPIDNLSIEGHNNRLTSMFANGIAITGHNNCFIKLTVGNISDSGMNNQFSECQRAGASQQSRRHAHQAYDSEESDVEVGEEADEGISDTERESDSSFSSDEFQTARGGGAYYDEMGRQGG